VTEEDYFRNGEDGGVILKWILSTSLGEVDGFIWLRLESDSAPV
jgi:hypothetical protein